MLFDVSRQSYLCKASGLAQSTVSNAYLTEYQLIRDVCAMLCGVHQTAMYHYTDTGQCVINDKLQLAHLTQVRTHTVVQDDKFSSYTPTLITKAINSRTMQYRFLIIWLFTGFIMYSLLQLTLQHHLYDLSYYGMIVRDLQAFVDTIAEVRAGYCHHGIHVTIPPSLTYQAFAFVLSQYLTHYRVNLANLQVEMAKQSTC